MKGYLLEKKTEGAQIKNVKFPMGRVEDGTGTVTIVRRVHVPTRSGFSKEEVG